MQGSEKNIRDEPSMNGEDGKVDKSALKVG